MSFLILDQLTDVERDGTGSFAMQTSTFNTFISVCRSVCPKYLI